MREIWCAQKMRERLTKGKIPYLVAAGLALGSYALAILNHGIEDASAQDISPTPTPLSDRVHAPIVDAQKTQIAIGVGQLTPATETPRPTPTMEPTSTPEPTATSIPTPTPEPAMPWECNVAAMECNEDHVKAAIVHASQEIGVNRLLLDCLAEKESHFNPYRISITNDHGPFQFHLNPPNPQRPYRWTMMDTTPWAQHSVYEPYGSSMATAWLIRNGVKYASQGGWTAFPLCAQFDTPVRRVAFQITNSTPQAEFNAMTCRLQVPKEDLVNI